MSNKLELVKIEPQPETGGGKSERHRRYELDQRAHKHFQAAGSKAAHRLRMLLENDAAFEALGPRNQLAVISLALDRAYGKTETVTAEEKALPAENTAALPNNLRQIAAGLSLPEMQNAKKAEK